MAILTLNSNQAAALAHLGMDAEQDAGTLASKLGISPRAARYATDSLYQLKIAEPRPVIDIHRLGLTRYHLLFSLAPTKRAARERWIKELIAAEATLFLAEMGGRFDYQLSLATRSAEEALDALSRFSGVEIREKALTVRVKQLQLPRRYLLDKPIAAPGFETGQGKQTLAIDDLDHRLLKMVSDRPLASKSTIAGKLHIPVSTVHYRLRRLRDHGIFAGTTVAVNCSRYGAQAYIVTLTSKGFPSANARGVFEFAKNNPYCTHFVQCLGAWDFELGIEVPAFSNLQEVIDGISEKFGGALTSIEVLPRYGILKYSAYPFKNNPTATPKK